MRVYIYNDAGASRFCLEQTVECFSALGCTTSFIDSATLYQLASSDKVHFRFLPFWIETSFFNSLYLRGVLFLSCPEGEICRIWKKLGSSIKHWLIDRLYLWYIVSQWSRGWVAPWVCLRRRNLPRVLCRSLLRGLLHTVRTQHRPRQTTAGIIKKILLIK